MIAVSSTLFRYIGRQFLFNLFALMGILLGIMMIFDIAEFLRRTADMQHVRFGLMISMSLMKLPYLGEHVLPMVVLFTSIYTCWKLNKTSELMVIRSAGLSAWQFLSPMIVYAVLIGVFSTTILNPLSSVFLGKYQQLESVYLKNNVNFLMTVSKTGIWLRQPTEHGYALIHSESFDSKEWQLNNVIVLFFDDADNFISRIDGPMAYLKKGYWEVRQPLVNGKAGLQRLQISQLPTELTAQKIEESFADPDTISFWSIPEYANIMEQTGFPATRLYIHFQSLLAQPFLFAAMVLLAATFSLRPPRIGGTAYMIALGVGVGFFVFFTDSMLQTFGVSQKIPAHLAAWSPAIIALLFGGTALLHLEDG